MTKLKCKKFGLIESGLWSVTYQGINVTVLGLYRPPYTMKNKYTDNKFVDDFLELLVETLPLHNNFIIMGDINFHWNDTLNPLTDILKNSLNALGLKQLVQEFTHKDGNIIDTIIIEEESMPVRITTVGEFLSDHRFVSVETIWKKDNQTISKVKQRNLKEIDHNKMKKDIEIIELNTEANVTSVALELENNLVEVLNAHAPEKIQTIIKRALKPWMSTSIMQARKDYRKCVSIWNRDKNKEKWNAVIQSRKAYVKTLKVAKKDFYSDKVQQNKGNIKGLYNTVNGLINRDKENPLPEGRSDAELAEHFSNFFYQKVKKIADKLEQYPDYVPPKRNVPQFSKFSPVDEKDIAAIITKLGRKQCDLDIFLADLIQHHKSALASKLAILINKSLEEGSFPNNWKNAIVKPLIKKLSMGPVDTNYRPVSNLKYFAKVLECVVLKQITHHCESNKLLPCHQSAYRKNFSCETMLLKLSDIILNNMEHQQITSVIACDLSAAFDTVNFNILLATFENYYGITGNVLKWITSYLNGRSCQVVVNGTYSEKRDLTL